MAARKQIFPISTVVAVVIVLLIVFFRTQQSSHEPTAALKPGDYLFCFWNVENFFDDVDDNRNRIDDDYDDWMANNTADRELKLRQLTNVLLSLNGGKGPDILALAEVEGQRAAELLMEALNSRITDAGQKYKTALVKEVAVGRHIAPAIITRLPVVKGKTKQIGRKKQRTIEVHIKPKDRPELIVFASHWTSRRNGGESGREEYANDLYGRFRQIFQQNKNVDVLVSGDFNDGPDDVSVMQHLHATGDMSKVQGQNGPLPQLFNLMAGKDPRVFGTFYYSDWHLFDQIAVSPGMLDRAGWSCQPDSAATIKQFANNSGQSTLKYPGKIGRPWRFGNRNDDPKRRGFSDHFPVSVVLTLHDDARIAGR